MSAFLAAFRGLTVLASLLFHFFAVDALASSVREQGTWDVTLSPRDLDRNGSVDAFYDTALNITWLRELRPYDHMQWASARAWASTLDVGGYSGWRLPFVIDTGAIGCDLSYAGGTDCGYNVNTVLGTIVYSEMANLYYVTLGNLAHCTPGDAFCSPLQPGYGLTNTGDFLGLLPEVYWSETGYGMSAPFYAWMFSMDGGYQNDFSADRFAFAIPVHDGDIGVAVPIPGSVPLGLSAVVMHWAYRRARRFALFVRERRIRAIVSVGAGTYLQIPANFRNAVVGDDRVWFLPIQAPPTSAQKTSCCPRQIFPPSAVRPETPRD